MTRRLLPIQNRSRRMRLMLRLPAKHGHDTNRLHVRPVNDQERVHWKKQDRTIGEVHARMSLPWHPSSDANNSENSLSMRFANSTLSSAMRRQISKRSFCASAETAHSGVVSAAHAAMPPFAFT